MSKYTPGPWRTDEDKHDAPYQDFRIFGGQSHERWVCTIWQDDAPLHDFNAEQYANARLIAAAPELLEALKRIRQLDEGTHPSWRAEWAAIAEAAIAKADPT